MPRIRSIHPSFWTDRKMAKEMTRDQRLLYVALWNQADDEGRFRADPRLLLGACFPFDRDLTESFSEDSLSLYVRTHRLVLYEVGGEVYGWLTRFSRYQKPCRPTASRLPAPPADLVTLSEASVSNHGGLNGNHVLELGVRNQEVGSRNPPTPLQGESSIEQEQDHATPTHIQRAAAPLGPPQITLPDLEQPAAQRSSQAGDGAQAAGATTGDAARGGADSEAQAGAGSRRQRKPAPGLEACQPVIDLWRRLMVPARFPDPSPGGWKDARRTLVAKAAADLPDTERLFRRVLASPFLRDKHRPDLAWVLADGRERIEDGRYDPREGAGMAPDPNKSRIVDGHDPWVSGVDCSGLTQMQILDIRSEAELYGRGDTPQGAAVARRRLAELLGKGATNA